MRSFSHLGKNSLDVYDQGLTNVFGQPSFRKWVMRVNVNRKFSSKIAFSLCLPGLGQLPAVLVVENLPVFHLAVCPTVAHHLAPGAVLESSWFKLLPFVDEAVSTNLANLRLLRRDGKARSHFDVLCNLTKTKILDAKPRIQNSNDVFV